MLRSCRYFAVCVVTGVCGLLVTVESAIAATPLSQPQYRVIFEQDVAIPVRDGTVLRADIYRPDTGRDTTVTFPVLMSLSAYQKSLDRILPHVRPFTHVERPE
ncbi:MAG: hypothetical protein OEM60_15265, partial [Gammaproteobacteria bacterium]|nr:hypothetical protein [Gammaproteobacteria bacterium]